MIKLLRFMTLKSQKTSMVEVRLSEDFLRVFEDSSTNLKKKRAKNQGFSKKSLKKQEKNNWGFLKISQPQKTLNFEVRMRSAFLHWGSKCLRMNWKTSKFEVRMRSVFSRFLPALNQSSGSPFPLNLDCVARSHGHHRLFLTYSISNQEKSWI